MRMLLLFAVILLAGCQTALPPLPAWQSPEGREHADLGRIVDLRSGEQLSPQQLVQRLATAQRLLVGEQHDNPDHHALQLWLLQALATQRRQGSVLLEMLTPDQQPRIAAVRARIADGLPIEGLAILLNWNPGWDWSLYSPIVRHALAQRYPLLAANLQQAEISRIYRQRPILQGALSNTPAVRETLLAQIRLSHCGQMPESQLPAMLAVQQQRDRRMAEALLAAPAPSLLLAGAYHVRRDLGVPLHLADLGAPTGDLVLMLAEVGEPVDASMADLVWYTAALPQQDHCADFGRSSQQ
nr:ChaN family lipoprotein [uncultured Pseudomonas sp.]